MLYEALYWLCLVLGGCATGMASVLLYHTAVVGRSAYKIPAHIIPLAASYTLLTLFISDRVYMRAIQDPTLIALLSLSFAAGIWGLWIVIETKSRGAQGGPGNAG